MNTNEFEKVYLDIQKETNVLYKEAKPILKKLKKFFIKCGKLGVKVDNDEELYKIKHNKNPIVKTINWNIYLLFALQNSFNGVKDIDEIDNILYNIKHTKFKQMKYNTHRGNHL